MNLKPHKIILFTVLFLGGMSTLIAQLVTPDLSEPRNPMYRDGAIAWGYPDAVLSLTGIALCLCGAIGFYVTVVRDRKLQGANDTTNRGIGLKPHKIILITVLFLGGMLTLIGGLMRPDQSEPNNSIHRAWGDPDVVLSLTGIAICLCGALGVYIMNVRDRKNAQNEQLDESEPSPE